MHMHDIDQMAGWYSATGMPLVPEHSLNKFCVKRQKIENRALSAVAPPSQHDRTALCELLQQYVQHSPTSAAAEVPLPETAAEMAAYRNQHGQYAGEYVQLGQAVDGCTHAQLGKLLGFGGFGTVHAAVLLDLSGSYSSNGSSSIVDPGNQLKVQRYGESVAVKIFQGQHRLAPDHQQQIIKNELRALRALQGQPSAVQMLAEGSIKLPKLQSASTAAALAVAQNAAAAAQPQPVDTPAISSSNSSSSTCQCAVLELMDGNLWDVMRYIGLFPEPAAKVVAVQLLQALQAMRSEELDNCSIVNGDLKPHNLLWTLDGRIVVSDYGSCCILQRAEAAAAAEGAAPDDSVSIKCATPWYRAPDTQLEHLQTAVAKAEAEGRPPKNLVKILSSLQEYVGRSDGKYTGSIDVWATGIITLQMLALEFPAGAADQRTIEQVLEWVQFVEDVVNTPAGGSYKLVDGLVLSELAKDFIGCCCGLGSKREAAAATGEPRRLSPAQLLKHPWLAQPSTAPASSYERYRLRNSNGVRYL